MYNITTCENDMSIYTEACSSPDHSINLKSVSSPGVMDTRHWRWAVGRDQTIKSPVSLRKEGAMHSESSGGSGRKTESKGETWPDCFLEGHSWDSELREWPLDGRGKVWEIIGSWSGVGPGDQLDVEDKGKRSPGSWVTPKFLVMPLSDNRKSRRDS